jgi:hypothetical protein
MTRSDETRSLAKRTDLLFVMVGLDPTIQAKKPQRKKPGLATGLLFKR